MSDYAIKFENIGEQYRLGMIGTGTVSHDLNRWWAKIRGKEDPFLQVGLQKEQYTDSSKEDYMWALRNIDLEVRKGEVLGIIGKNGAGKSTLLKILSRITTPTTGQIHGYGRIASLLEIGTGFHPEMTGRENVFMNGSIMGMSKKEIKSKFDEIVAFAGVEKYIETPVKRYSSGMMVRLGFAVAAHLEPEILVVDEVLAVGDAEFQKKCIGKMESISKAEGRTILFVSHNMTAVEKLCNKACILTNGELTYYGGAQDAVGEYLKKEEISGSSIISGKTIIHPDMSVSEVKVNSLNTNIIPISSTDRELKVNIKGELKARLKMALEIRIYDQRETMQAFFSPGHLYGEMLDLPAGPFEITERIQLPENMNSGEYIMDIDLTTPNVEYFLHIPKHVKLNVDGVVGSTGLNFDQGRFGLLMLNRVGN